MYGKGGERAVARMRLVGDGVSVAVDSVHGSHGGITELRESIVAACMAFPFVGEQIPRLYMEVKAAAAKPED